jgi:hypothetical protein
LHSELVCGASLLLCALGIAAPLFHRTRLVAGQTRIYQVACYELRNQLDHLRTIPSSELQSAIDHLVLPQRLLEAIPEATLMGKLESQSLPGSVSADRITLTLQLPSSIREEPIEIVGWLFPNEGTHE